MHDIYKQGNLPYLSVKMCPNCEELLPLNVESCPNCSYNFTSKSMAQPQLREKKVEKEIVQPATVYQVSKATETEENAQPETKKVEKFVFCDNCGSKIIGSQRYCGGCGAKVSKRICPSCEQIVDANLTFCPLCGEKLQEPSNVAQVETAVTNQTPVQPVQQVQPIPQFYGQPQGYNGQPINIYLNPNTMQPQNVENAIQVESTPTEAVEVVEEAKEEEEVEKKKDNKGINMGRKRLFLIIQLLIVGVIAAIMVMVPILTADKFFEALIPCITGSSNESLISGKDIFTYVMECINQKSINLTVDSSIYSKISKDGQVLFTGIPFIYQLLSLISKNPENLSVIISIVVVLFSYALIALAMLIALLSGFIGLFVRRPYRGKALGFLLVSFVIAAAFIYTSVFTKTFVAYDSWLLYAFALIFFVWFIVKVVFSKEAKMYKKAKEQAKLAKEVEDDE